MKIVGIVSEYNPFHSGHIHHITESRRRLGEDCPVVCAMSGHWTQCAGWAAADKWTRAAMALDGGVDLVLELPTVWATASAEGFARGAVALLAAAGVVTHLSFGSEAGTLEGLQRVADCVDSPDYPAVLKTALRAGRSFPAARQRAVEALTGDGAQVLSAPNNNLGVEYLRALRSYGNQITPLTVLRQGAGYADARPGDRPSHQSATALRRALYGEDWEMATPYLTREGGRLLQSGMRVTAESARLGERAVLARLRTMTLEQWRALPDSGAGEGLPERLLSAARRAAGLEELLTLAKTKRYPRTRLVRLVVRAYLGLSTDCRPQSPPYLRVLGMNRRGQSVLAAMRDTCALPVLTKPAQANKLAGAGAELFALEARCTDLWTMFLPVVPPAGLEYTTSPVVTGRSGQPSDARS